MPASTCTSLRLSLSFFPPGNSRPPLSDLRPTPFSRSLSILGPDSAVVIDILDFKRLGGKKASDPSLGKVLVRPWDLSDVQGGELLLLRGVRPCLSPPGLTPVYMHSRRRTGRSKILRWL